MKTKKLILILLMTVGITTGCEKSLSRSSKPTFFVIQTITQDYWDKKTNVCRYEIQVWTTYSDGSLAISKNDWFTLQEGFQIGDTLRLTK